MFCVSQTIRNDMLSFIILSLIWANSIHRSVDVSISILHIVLLFMDIYDTCVNHLGNFNLDPLPYQGITLHFGIDGV